MILYRNTLSMSFFRNWRETIQQCNIDHALFASAVQARKSSFIWPLGPAVTKTNNWPNMCLEYAFTKAASQVDQAMIQRQRSPAVQPPKSNYSSPLCGWISFDQMALCIMLGPNLPGIVQHLLNLLVYWARVWNFYHNETPMCIHVQFVKTNLSAALFHSLQMFRYIFLPSAWGSW